MGTVLTDRRLVVPTATAMKLHVGGSRRSGSCDPSTPFDPHNEVGIRGSGRVDQIIIRTTYIGPRIAKGNLVIRNYGRKPRGALMN